jgi:hypothetical protein
MSQLFKMDIVWTQDYQEVYFQSELHGKEYNMFTLKITPKQVLSLADCVNKLPTEVRMMILSYLKQLLTYTGSQLPRALTFEFFVFHREALNDWARRTVSHNCVYSCCKGYCLNCGEPAQALRNVVKEKREDPKWRYRLPVYGLALMGICYFCICMGYNYDKVKGTVEAPSLVRLKNRKMHYPNITTQKWGQEPLYDIYSHNPN